MGRGVGLQIVIRESGDITILDLRGRSSINDVESTLLSTHLQKLVASGVRKMLLNLSNLTQQVDSNGVTVIVKAYVTLRVHGGDLRLVRPCGHALDVFKELRLIELIPSFEDETHALASFQPLSTVARR